jgi:twitching motility two-component system response regulator PilG
MNSQDWYRSTFVLQPYDFVLVFNHTLKDFGMFIPCNLMAQDTFTIASIGFDEQEQNVLLSLVTLAKNRQPRFILFDTSPDKNKRPANVLVVNADKPEAVQRWSAYIKLNESKTAISTVMVSNDPPPAKPGEKILYVKKPLAATRLLTILEEVVILEHGYTAPAAIAGEITTGQGAATAPIAGGAVNHIAALVVDDSLPVRIQMKKALRHIAGRVDFAETGEAAEKLIRDNTYDIVFLDVILPGVDGYDICKMIKKDPQKRKTPVIMLTSNSSPADRIKGKMAGCDTYLIKPVNQDIFKEVIHEYLDLD